MVCLPEDPSVLAWEGLRRGERGGLPLVGCGVWEVGAHDGAAAVAAFVEGGGSDWSGMGGLN